MKETIFNLVEDTLRVSDRFNYRVYPGDYITLTKEVIKNKNLFAELESIEKDLASGVKDDDKKRDILRHAKKLKNYEHINPDEDSDRYLSDILKDYETYRYFYKEIGASLKFNPLSKSDAGYHIVEKILSFLEVYAELINPKALFRLSEVIPNDQGLLVQGTDIQFLNKKLKIFTSHSNTSGNREISPDELKDKNIVVYVVTIGPGIDDQVKKLMKKGEMFDAYILNGIGAGAAEMVANDLNRYMNDVNQMKNYEYKRLSPGYGEWNVSDQTKIFKLLNPEKYIGVRLTESYIMLPEKSTSGIMGLTLKEGL